MTISFNRGERKAREFAYEVMRKMGYPNPSYLHVGSSQTSSAAVADANENLKTYFSFRFEFVIDEQKPSERECIVEVDMTRYSSFPADKVVRSMVHTWSMTTVSYVDPGPDDSTNSEWPSCKMFEPEQDAGEFAVKLVNTTAVE